MPDDCRYIVRNIEKDIEWTALLDEVGGDNLFISTNWGDYKESRGWAIHRLAIIEQGSSSVCSLCQVQFKGYFFSAIRVFLIQGGPVIKEDSKICSSEIFPLVLDHLKIKNSDVVLCQAKQAFSDRLCMGLIKSGFKQVVSSSSYTPMVDLSMGENDLMGSLTRNWRHNLKRSTKNNLEIRWVPNSENERLAAFTRMSFLYDTLTSRKAFKNAMDVQLFSEKFLNNRNLEFVEIISDGEVIASRIGYRGQKIMLDLLAASNEKATKNYATYLALWCLILKAKETNMDFFDCGGIDPWNNPGVYNFKMGLNPSMVLSESDWVFSKSNLLSKIIPPLLLFLK